MTTDSSIEEHFSAASDVIFGQVASGVVLDRVREQRGVGESGNIESYFYQFQSGEIGFRVERSLKGQLDGEVTLGYSFDPLQSGFELGMHYVVFLYDGRITWCGKVMRLNRSVISLEETLRRMSQWPADQGGVDAAELLYILEFGG